MSEDLKRLLRPLVPGGLLKWKAALVHRLRDRQFAGQSPREVFTRVYEQGVWGTNGAVRYSSGPGSHDAAIVDAYVAAVRSFLATLPDKPDAVDLGCGDFNVGRQLRDGFAGYVACDVVPAVIEENRRRYANLDVDFRCVDIIEEALPAGQVVLLRQVLQHLGNAQIARVVEKLPAYRYLILTEHLPAAADFVPNLDKPSGPGIRLGRGCDSGVVLTLPPFSLPARSERVICESRQLGGVIRTTVYEL